MPLNIDNAEGESLESFVFLDFPSVPKIVATA